MQTMQIVQYNQFETLNGELLVMIFLETCKTRSEKNLFNLTKWPFTSKPSSKICTLSLVCKNFLKIIEYYGLKFSFANDLIPINLLKPLCLQLNPETLSNLNCNTTDLENVTQLIYTDFDGDYSSRSDFTKFCTNSSRMPLKIQYIDLNCFAEPLNGNLETIFEPLQDPLTFKYFIIDCSEVLFKLPQVLELNLRIQCNSKENNKVLYIFIPKSKGSFLQKLRISHDFEYIYLISDLNQIRSKKSPKDQCLVTYPKLKYLTVEGPTFIENLTEHGISHLASLSWRIKEDQQVQRWSYVPDLNIEKVFIDYLVQIQTLIFDKIGKVYFQNLGSFDKIIKRGLILNQNEKSCLNFRTIQQITPFLFGDACGLPEIDFPYQSQNLISNIKSSFALCEKMYKERAKSNSSSTEVSSRPEFYFETLEKLVRDLYSTAAPHKPTFEIPEDHQFPIFGTAVQDKQNQSSKLKRIVNYNIFVLMQDIIRRHWAQNNAFDQKNVLLTKNQSCFETLYFQTLNPNIEIGNLTLCPKTVNTLFGSAALSDKLKPFITGSKPGEQIPRISKTFILDFYRKECFQFPIPDSKLKGKTEEEAKALKEFFILMQDQSRFKNEFSMNFSPHLQMDSFRFKPESKISISSLVRISEEVNLKLKSFCINEWPATILQLPKNLSERLSLWNFDQSEWFAFAQFHFRINQYLLQLFDNLTFQSRRNENPQSISLLKLRDCYFATKNPLYQKEIITVFQTLEEHQFGFVRDSNQIPYCQEGIWERIMKDQVEFTKNWRIIDLIFYLMQMNNWMMTAPINLRSGYLSSHSDILQVSLPYYRISDLCIKKIRSFAYLHLNSQKPKKIEELIPVRVYAFQPL